MKIGQKTESQRDRARIKSRQFIRRGECVSVEVIKVAEDGGSLCAHLWVIDCEGSRMRVVRAGASLALGLVKGQRDVKVDVVSLQPGASNVSLTVCGVEVGLSAREMVGVARGGVVTTFDMEDWMEIREWAGVVEERRSFDIPPVGEVL